VCSPTPPDVRRKERASERDFPPPPARREAGERAPAREGARESAPWSNTKAKAPPGKWNAEEERSARPDHDDDGGEESVSGANVDGEIS